mmetsp:Transcript_7196/g.21173  ORF Transcript_7196/g.21173 Transcript_7196/m.21173 type:complete len:450 (-) Transcript_7196:3238-4587(-)
MKKAFGRLQLRAGAKDAKANGKDAGRLDTAAEPAAQPSSKITEHVRQDEVETAAAMSTGTATHSSEESHADTDYDHRQEDGELGRQQLSGSLNSEGDRYSYADSQGSSDRSHSDDEGDPQNEPLLDNPYYRKLQDLNRGASGFVQLAVNLKTREQVAIKFLERGGGASQRVIARELLNHRECALHPNIVQLKEVFLTTHHLGIALEYADGGDLSEYIDNHAQNGQMGCPEDEARWFFQQFIIGLDYCHRMGIANRDIKLDNILLHGRGERPVVKICDFGYSKDEVAGSICKTACGTPEYMAPEVLTTELYDGKVADIWSCGVMLYVLLMGTFPFARQGDEDMKNAKALQMMFGRIIKADYEEPDEVSEECRDLLRGLLKADPAKRLTVSQVQAHPWFKQDLPAGALEVNSRLKLMDNVRYGQCKQTAQQILDLVEECNNYHPDRSQFDE